MSNRLAQAPGLYLRQHGEDPVDWFPWGDEALQLARESGKPILLSLGYSACHWCHVMARESFSDAETAALMNQHFVCIKVDREEHPEIDRVYQTAHQAMQRRAGGWPLTAFLNPESLLPFFIGTYFPPQRAHGLPAFSDVLRGIARWVEERSSELQEQQTELRRFFDDNARDDPWLGELGDAPRQSAEQRWLERADPVNGGTRGVPKFPPTAELGWALHGSNEALRRHARLTLDRMARGGLQDQIGGGFFRYCVDADWGIPHFEKMLCDNALLLPLYAEYAAEGDSMARSAAIGIVRWLDEEMQLPGGGYAAALSAESEAEEGAYYLWSEAAWRAALEPEQHVLAARYFGLDQAPNGDAGRWHLRVALEPSELAVERGLSEDALHQQLKTVARRLQLARAGRTPPQRDDKFLCGWNGLLLSGLARAGRAMQRGDWIEQAQRLAEDLRRTFWADGRLLAVANQGVPRGAGCLDDYAAVLLGLLDLLECRWRRSDLEFAIVLCDSLLANFEDTEFGGCWLSAHDEPRLPHRPKPWFDEATPAGNGLAAQALQRLGDLVCDSRYLQAAERILRAGWVSMEAVPEACASLLPVLRERLQPSPLLIARLGDAHEYERWQPALEAMRHDGARVVILPSEETLLPTALEDKRWLRGGRVYWCESLRCLPRFDSPVGLLGKRGAARE